MLEGAHRSSPPTRRWRPAGSLLHADLVVALDGLPAAHDYRFPRARKPFLHQAEAWRLLAEPEPQSVLVTSGTGSGKTECFLFPILSDLVAQAQGRREPLEGVQAIMLYPLNALIESQRERLSAWTQPFGGKVRYCLYNGDLPRAAKESERRRTPEEVVDRERLRANPPPLLVTNITMLEYMLVRAEDRPLIEASQGKLKWIVLDEAHSLVGAAAAENRPRSASCSPSPSSRKTFASSPPRRPSPEARLCANSSSGSGRRYRHSRRPGPCHRGRAANTTSTRWRARRAFN